MFNKSYSLSLSFTVKQAWHKASEQDVNMYKARLDELLNKIVVDDDLLRCSGINCMHHTNMISVLCNDVISACIAARWAKKVKPGWNENVKEFKNEALTWHVLWKSNGCPRDGYFAEQRRITKARYHRAIRHIERNANKIRMEKMADAVLSNSSTDLWRGVEKIKPKIIMMSSTVDGSDDCESIASMFSDKYIMLFNSVPYDTEEMKRIESEVLSRVQRGSDSNYCITVQDVMNAVTHLKLGKSDGSEGLFSDHFINVTRKLYVFLSILFTVFLCHGFSPDSMIWSAMIPIPKDKKKSLCSSSNYRAIALSKILDWIILIKEQHSLCSSELQFGFKKGLSTTQCTFSMLEIIDYYIFNKSSVNLLMLDASRLLIELTTINCLLHC